MGECNCPSSEGLPECNDDMKSSEYTFEDNICYKDGEKFGLIVEEDSDTIKIKCTIDNRYMQGQIITMVKIKE